MFFTGKNGYTRTRGLRIVPDPTRKTSTRTRPIPAGTGRAAHLYFAVRGPSVGSIIVGFGSNSLWFISYPFRKISMAIADLVTLKMSASDSLRISP